MVLNHKFTTYNISWSNKSKVHNDGNNNNKNNFDIMPFGLELCSITVLSPEGSSSKVNLTQSTTSAIAIFSVTLN